MPNVPLLDQVAALGGTMLTILAIPAKFVRGNHQRSKQNKRQLQGDPDDPNAEGVLQIANETREQVEHLDEKMDQQHEAVLERVEDLAEERRGHD